MSRFWFIVIGVFGLVLMFVGLASLSDGKVLCGGQRMYPGDTCVVYNGDFQYELNYEEQKSSHQRGLKFAVVAGVALVVISILLVLPRRRPRTPGAAAQSPPAV